MSQRVSKRVVRSIIKMIWGFCAKCSILRSSRHVYIWSPYEALIWPSCPRNCVGGDRLLKGLQMINPFKNRDHFTKSAGVQFRIVHCVAVIPPYT